MKEIKWGLIGTGSIAAAFAHSIKKSKNSDLISVFGRNKKTLDEFSKKFNLEAFKAFDEFISSKNLDAVYIATPHNSHFLYSLGAINKGKHVLCEKPLAMNSQETMILINESKKNNVFLMEAFMYRVHPQTELLINLIKENFSDEKIKIESSFGFNADIPKDHRLRNLNLAGGAILDVGCYPLSMSRLIAGTQNNKKFMDPEKIDVSVELDETGVDKNSIAKIIFSEKVEAEIKTAINEDLPNNLVIKSKTKKIVVPQTWHCGQFQEGKSSISLIKENSEEEVFELSDSIGLFTREINHASEAILNGKIESELMTHADTLGNMIWLENWYKDSGVNYPQNLIKESPILNSSFTSKKLIIKSNISDFNKTGSRIVFGCDNQTSSLHAHVMFDHFFEHGGNIFDTAYIYNAGKSDSYLGDWISSRNVSKDIIVLGKGAHTPECEPKFIRPQLEESLERLNLERLDIYCLHRDNIEVPVEEFVDVLNELKDDGLINFFGASNWTFDRFKDAMDYAEFSKKAGFKVLSNNFSLAEMINPVWPGCVNCDEDFLTYLIEKEVLLFPWSSTARGFFVEKDLSPKTNHFSNPTLEEEKRVWHNQDNLIRRQKCFELSKELGCSSIELALAYVLNKHSNIFPLVGPRTLFESESCMQATNIKLSENQMNWLIS